MQRGKQGILATKKLDEFGTSTAQRKNTVGEIKMKPITQNRNSVLWLPLIAVFAWSNLVTARSPVNMLTSVCERKWELIYTHDEYGNATFGSKKELIQLALTGNYIRARLYMPDHMLHLPADSISKYKDQICFQSLRALANNGTHVDSAEPWLHFMVCTSGHVTEQDVSNVSTFRVPMDWYVKDISHKSDPVFSNFLDGTPMKPMQILQLHEAAKRMSLFGAMRDRPYVFPFHNVILDPETGEVNGQNVLHMGQRYEKLEKYITFHKIPYQWFSYWSNLGHRDNARWSARGHTAYNHNADTATLDWYADECWRLVFTNDGNGFPIYGAIDDLIDAVKRGHRVRVRFDDQAAEVSNLRVKGDVVAAQLLQEVTRVGGYGNDRYYIEADTRVKFSIAHTTGTVVSYEYLVGSPSRKVNPPTRRVIEWMVDTRPWTVVLETMDPPGQVPRRGDGQGDTQVDTVLRGSVFDLKDAVMGGASIRLNVLLDPLAGSFFTQANNIRADVATDTICAQAMDHMSDQKSRIPDEYELQKNLFHWYLTISSEGTVRMTAWNFGEDTFRYDENAPEATVTWFANL
ncbi:hypothetical protein RRG08_009346 [Elysia crispata]|uniref:Uncharacterized protein n=1 Tax=Elysia crispata TaxID=231223 RepID=A0AAE0Y4D9_9GAST|nr:hypothetical protein RRG08_009346 [Elysia crispata]